MRRLELEVFPYGLAGRAYIGRGNPARLKPMPMPVPCLALDPIDGANVSRMAKVAAAESPMMNTSSISSFLCLGIAKAQIATITPSTIYLMALLTSSPNSKGALISDIYMYAIINGRIPEYIVRIRIRRFLELHRIGFYLVDPAPGSGKHKPL
jgi:hypothetical protein